MAESPTSLAMYSSLAFYQWLEGLCTVKTNFESFVDKELERNGMVHLYWEKKTLLHLFTDVRDVRYDSTEISGWIRCADCRMTLWHDTWEHLPCEYDQILIQPHWRHSIERVK